MLASTSAAANGQAVDGFEGPVSDIDVLPDGSTVAVGGDLVQRVTTGEVTTVAPVGVAETAPPSTLNGVAATGRGNVFATSGGGNAAEGAALWRVSPGNARLVGDIEAFEVAHDPDVSAWKDARCEESAMFTAGPQSNPYHVSATSGGGVLLADAAGNSILTARTNGAVDWLAVLTPPLVEVPASSSDYRVLFSLPDGTDCFVQPVPTSVDVSPDGESVFVGELTGLTGIADMVGDYETGVSRVWSIDADARHAVCTEETDNPCEVAITGLTSVVDVVFGPDGRLYVAEYDMDGWFTPGSGGTVLACDVSGSLPVERGECETIHTADGVTVDALTFDKKGGLRVLEDGVGVPVVRHLSP